MTEVTSFPLRMEFGPEQTDAMGKAFELAYAAIKNKRIDGRSPDEVRALVAHRILEKAELGETDPQRLANYAVAMFSL
jgi:hypothetical protein